MRAYAAPFLVATLAALVVDAALQLGLDAVRVSGFAGGAPWWVTAHLVERGRWVVLASLLWWLAAGVDDGDERGIATANPGEAWRRVALAVIAVPLLWVLATWLVTAIRFTLLASWDTDGRVFRSGDYYRAVLVDYAPWFMAGAVLFAARKHVAGNS